VSGRDRLRGCGRRLSRALHAQNRKIRSRVRAGQGRGGVLAIGQRDQDLLLAPNGVLGGDDHAGPPEYTARRESRARVDRNHVFRRRLDCRGHFLRKRY
jgi:hypothetical protein